MVAICVIVIREFCIPWVIQNLRVLNYENHEILIMTNFEKSKFSNLKNDRLTFIPIPNDKTTIGERRNILLRMCESEFVMFMDDDDIQNSNRIDNQLKCMTKGVNISCSKHHIVYFKDERKSVCFNGFCESSLMIRNHKGIEFLELDSNEGRALKFRKDFVFVPKPLNIMIHHGGNITKRQCIGTEVSYINLVVNKFLEDSKNIYDNK